EPLVPQVLPIRCLISTTCEMVWTACSPELNLTKHLWNLLVGAVFKEEDTIPQQCVTKLVTSMRRRVCAFYLKRHLHRSSSLTFSQTFFFFFS
uniref:Uncharacterized protein n=1 Tax=Neolamprologus brichardi TaxID=32507 RepID=A0A3Q4HH51_NEOBR